MSSHPKLRIALIGLGSIAEKAYLPILGNHTRVEPILCTRNRKTLSRLANQYRIEDTCSSLDELPGLKPDAAMVHSATESHGAIISKLLDADIPVFVDKPLSYSLDESEELIESAANKGLPLYLGFNRRFAPFISQLSEVSDPVQIAWQKNRVDLPGDPRVFIFDDFIHVVDSLRFLGKGPVQNVNVFSRFKDDQLVTIHVRWQQGKTLMLGGMNRISGTTEEMVEYYSEGNKWVIQDLNSGTHYKDEEEKTLTYDPWASALYKRGFVDMIEDWLKVMRERSFKPERYEDILATHQLCETILNELQAQRS